MKRFLAFSGYLFLCFLLILLSYASSAIAVPATGQFSPIGIYEDTQGAFGLSYNPDDDVIHWSQADAGDNLVHSLTPFKNIDTSGLDTGSRGEVRMNATEGGQDNFATTDPVAAGGNSARFSALGYDTESNRIVVGDEYNDNVSNTLEAFAPQTANNLDLDFRQGNADNPRFDLVDGLDIDGANTWFSGDIGAIQKNGALFASRTGVTLPTWSGLGNATTKGFSGVEQVGDSLFTVGVMEYGDTGRTRTILRFDKSTGELLGYDPDGDPIAARWEDLAYDGEYLYAADLRGDANNAGVDGDIYVFGVSGGLEDGGNGQQPIPEPTTWLLFGTGLIGLAGLGRKKFFKKA